MDEYALAPLSQVNTKARKIFLILHKESDAEWPFLKS